MLTFIDEAEGDVFNRFNHVRAVALETPYILSYPLGGHDMVTNLDALRLRGRLALKQKHPKQTDVSDIILVWL
jgi:hypothetical protein